MIRRHGFCPLLCALSALSLPCVVGATDVTPPVPSSALPKIDVPAVGVSPRLDADVDDPAWSSAALIPSLPLAVGPEGAGKAPLPTVVRLLWEPDALFVRFLCRGGDLYAPYGTQPDAPQYKGDVAEIFVDPVGDAREFVEIEVGPANGTLSALHLLTTMAASGPDGVLDAQILKRDTWDVMPYHIPGLRSATKPWIEDGKTVGWIADFALPAAELLKRAGVTQFAPRMTLRANFVRYDYAPAIGAEARRMVAMNWSPAVWGRAHRSPQIAGYVTLLPPQNK